MARPPQRSAGTHRAPSRAVVVAYSLAAILAMAGLTDAVYLAVMHLTGQSAVCGASAGCSQVLSSKYAQIGPVPVALLGAVGYFSVFALAIFAACGYARAGRWLILAVAPMFVGSLWFLSLQAFVLHAFCPYCLFSAAITFVLAGLMLAITPPKP